MDVIFLTCEEKSRGDNFRASAVNKVFVCAKTELASELITLHVAPVHRA